MNKIYCLRYKIKVDPKSLKVCLANIKEKYDKNFKAMDSIYKKIYSKILGVSLGVQKINEKQPHCNKYKFLKDNLRKNSIYMRLLNIENKLFKKSRILKAMIKNCEGR